MTRSSATAVYSAQLAFVEQQGLAIARTRHYDFSHQNGVVAVVVVGNHTAVQERQGTLHPW